MCKVEFVLWVISWEMWVVCCVECLVLFVVNCKASDLLVLDRNGDV
jgi:hypothetical protein